MKESDEIQRIKGVYTARDASGVDANRAGIPYPKYITKEREKIYAEILQARFGKKVREIKVLEIGAGAGGNIPFFLKLGIRPNHFYANELMDYRIKHLKEKFPEIHVLEGDASVLNFDFKFDVIFQSTVFSSILDPKLRKSLASTMENLLHDDGIVLWYDFVFDNPKNKNVKKVELQEIKQLFENLQVVRREKTTLAPPIGRRIGHAYPLINIFPFLRTHLIVELDKKKN